MVRRIRCLSYWSDKSSRTRRWWSLRCRTRRKADTNREGDRAESDCEFFNLIFYKGVWRKIKKKSSQLTISTAISASLITITRVGCCSTALYIPQLPRPIRLHEPMIVHWDNRSTKQRHFNSWQILHRRSRILQIGCHAVIKWWSRWCVISSRGIGISERSCRQLVRENSLISIRRAKIMRDIGERCRVRGATVLEKFFKP